MCSGGEAFGTRDETTPKVADEGERRRLEGVYAWARRQRGAV